MFLVFNLDLKKNIMTTEHGFSLKSGSHKNIAYTKLSHNKIKRQLIVVLEFPASFTLSQLVAPIPLKMPNLKNYFVGITVKNNWSVKLPCQSFNRSRFSPFTVLALLKSVKSSKMSYQSIERSDTPPIPTVSVLNRLTVVFDHG